MEKIKIIIVDDHGIVRDGIKSLLTDCENFDVTGEASNYDELLLLLKKSVPDIAILDISLQGKSGIEIAGILSREYPSVKVMILSMHKDEDYIFNSLKSGAKGYLTKNITRRELRDAVNAIYEGSEYFSEQISDVILKSYVKKASAPNEPPNYKEDTLTRREREILGMAAEGIPNSEVAQKLFISVRTVESHKNHIMQKLGLKSNLDLIKFAVKKGIIKL